MKEESSADILKDVFYQDGSLRDIYVRETTAGDWEKLISFLKSGKYKVTYELDSTESALPTDFNDIRKYMGVSVQLLSVYIEDIRLNCHFFCTEEIELDLLPSEVETEEKAETILRFMAEIGRLLEKEVILTPENGQASVIVRYDPKANEMEYIPG